MNEYLRTLVDLIEKQDIDEGASLVIVANEGEPATVQVRIGMTMQFFVEAEDQSRLVLLATHAL